MKEKKGIIRNEMYTIDKLKSFRDEVEKDIDNEKI